MPILTRPSLRSFVLRADAGALQDFVNPISSATMLIMIDSGKSYSSDLDRTDSSALAGLPEASSVLEFGGCVETNSDCTDWVDAAAPHASSTGNSEAFIARAVCHQLSKAAKGHASMGARFGVCAVKLGKRGYGFQRVTGGIRLPTLSAN